jgi:hypothetical protein
MSEAEDSRLFFASSDMALGITFSCSLKQWRSAFQTERKQLRKMLYKYNIAQSRMQMMYAFGKIF